MEGRTECFHPSITGLDGELAADALGTEELVPVFLTVWRALL